MVDDFVAVMDVPMLTVEGIRRAVHRLIPEGSMWEQVWMGGQVGVVRIVLQVRE